MWDENRKENRLSVAKYKLLNVKRFPMPTKNLFVLFCFFLIATFIR